MYRRWPAAVFMAGAMLLFTGVALAQAPPPPSPSPLTPAHGSSHPITGQLHSSPMQHGVKPFDSIGTIKVDGTATGSAASGTYTIAAPSGQQSGDTIIAIQYGYTAPLTATGPTGFTDIADNSSGLINVHVWKGPSASSYTFGHYSDSETILMAINSADPDWTVNVSPVFSGGSSNATEVAPAVTPTVSNALLISAAGTAGPAPHTYTTPTGMTTAGTAVIVNEFATAATQVLSGGAFISTGTRTFTAGDAPSDAYDTVSMVIAPTQGYDPSDNWAGYVVGVPSSGEQFTNVQTTFVQPTVTCTDNNVWDLFWAGFDGFNNNTVEQAGTGVDCTGNTGGTVGVPHYFAWWETVPANSIQVSSTVTIHPGDTVHLLEQYNPSNSLFTLAVNDTTDNQAFTVPTQCGSSSGCQVNVAEAVAERTFNSNTNTYYDLGSFPDFQFTNVRAEDTADTTAHVFAYYPGATIQMKNSTNNDILAVPSPFIVTGDGYTVRWKAAS